ncbi:MAG TPA: substrate-binding domain-containing protein [Alphaproteobacteria bacterium]|nr:substrate-binding domain-containing protein [Alphaproteobacteria bacterium]
MPASPRWSPLRICLHGLFFALVFAGLAGPYAGSAQAQSAARKLRLVVPSALSRSGLLDRLLPQFERQTKIAVRVLVLEPPDALTLAGQGQADVLWLSDEERERAALKAGVVVERSDIMYGELIMLGPRADPAGLRGMTSVVEAVKLIASAEAKFASRADGSAVHRIESGIWEEASIEVDTPDAKSWYFGVKGGMRATIQEALRRNAYTIADRGTWLGMQRPRSYVPLVADDPRMVIQYGAMLVSPKLHKEVQAARARLFIKWLASKPVQNAINQFTIAGQYPYTANHGQRKSE